MLIEILTELYNSDKDLFPDDILTAEELHKHYQCFRTFRRTSNTRAIEQKVDLKDQQVVNRWRTFERAQGKRPNMPMHMHYAEVNELVKPFLRYTEAM